MHAVIHTLIGCAVKLVSQSDGMQHTSSTSFDFPLLCSLAGPAATQIGCSIKLVSQADGTDLDPAHTKYRPRGEGGPAAQVSWHGVSPGRRQGGAAMRKYMLGSISRLVG